jgi:hypothetical protein
VTISTIPKPVILDLLPLYLAGEVSAETRAIVEGYLESDPELRSLVKRAEGTGIEVAEGRLERRLEVTAFERTRKALGRRAWYLGFAIFFSLVPLSFQYETVTGLTFLFAKAPWTAIPWLIGAAILWVLYLRQPRLRAGG